MLINVVVSTFRRNYWLDR